MANKVTQLDEVEGYVQQGLGDSPEVIELLNDVQANIDRLEAAIAAVKAAPTPQPEAASSPPKKWNVEDHPAYRKQSATPAAAEEPKAAHVFKTGEKVSAKWMRDKSFYPAKIISITGSASAPIYTVVFDGYDEKATVRGHEIRPLYSQAQKRKADDSPVASNPSTPITTTMPASANTGVISAAANINPELALAAKKESAKPLDGPRGDKPAKKIKNSKYLNKSVSNWQSWQATSKTSGKIAKVVKKESMFRTGQSETARGKTKPFLHIHNMEMNSGTRLTIVTVGFTGSGNQMRKDAERSRHVYNVEDADE